MFDIFIEQRQYQTYILCDRSSGTQVEVVPERGGVITSWQVAGKEMFYLDSERFTHPELSVRGGNPILFPICGNLPNNEFTHGGKTYSLKQHGFAREMPWHVSEQSTAGSASLSVELTSNEQTRNVYPFDFQVTFTYSLQGHSLGIRQVYTNKSSEPMPFAAGFHPYFAVADKNSLKLQIPADRYADNVTKSDFPYSGTFDFSQAEIDAAFTHLFGPAAMVSDAERRSHLTVSYDKHFSTLVFWTVQGKDFYCLEPWTAPRNALITGEQLITLEPGASLEALVRYAVEFE